MVAFDDTYIDGPADLVVEVVSPIARRVIGATSSPSTQEAGVPEYWLIDEPRREAHFYVLGDRTASIR